MLHLICKNICLSRLLLSVCVENNQHSSNLLIKCERNKLEEGTVLFNKNKKQVAIVLIKVIYFTTTLS